MMPLAELRAAAEALRALDWAANVRAEQRRGLNGAADGIKVGHLPMLPGTHWTNIMLDAVEQKARDILRGAGVQMDKEPEA
jgi:hypothetical protein